jgi:hypothetical protein
MSADNAPLIYQPLTTRRYRYPTWIIIISPPIATVIERAYLGNEICSSLLSRHLAVGVPSILNNVAKSLSWILVDAPLPFPACYRNIVSVLHLACIPESDLHLNNAHVRIVLGAVVELLVTDQPASLERALIATKLYLEERWRGRFSFVPFKDILLDVYEFLYQVNNYFKYLFHSILDFFMYSSRFVFFSSFAIDA